MKSANDIKKMMVFAFSNIILFRCIRAGELGMVYLVREGVAKPAREVLIARVGPTNLILVEISVSIL